MTIQTIINFIQENIQMGDVIQAALPLWAIPATGGLISSIFGGSQTRRANRLEAQNTFTPYRESALLQQNLAEAQQRANIGLPREIYNNQLQQMQLGLSTGLRGISRGRTSAFNVASILSGYNRGLQNLSSLDAQTRLQSEQQLRQARGAVAQDQRYAYNVNYLQPYQQTRQDIASMRRAGNQNIFGGLSLIGQSLFYGLGMGNQNTNSLV